MLEHWNATEVPVLEIQGLTRLISIHLPLLLRS